MGRSDQQCGRRIEPSRGSLSEYFLSGGIAPGLVEVLGDADDRAGEFRRIHTGVHLVCLRAGDAFPSRPMETGPTNKASAQNFALTCHGVPIHVPCFSLLEPRNIRATPMRTLTQQVQTPSKP
jgi:hypothetical protein